jgi:EmrB/QacA subfamily drug resistance transporter
VTAPPAHLGTPAGRWIITAAVLGSGVAFLDGSVVNAALPAISADFHAGLTDLQWVLTAYLLSLGSFIVIGGSLGDLFGRRRMFVVGLLGFGVASLLCGIAPTVGFLIAARVLQGAAGALLVPESLAIISSSFALEDRARAIGAWSGLTGVATAFGPFLGGWLIDSVSWRLVFFMNLPLIALTAVLAVRHVPESRDEGADGRIDLRGGLCLAAGLGSLVFALIEGPSGGWSGAEILLAILGAVLLVVFVLLELRSDHPMVPLRIFRSSQFSGANAVTFVVYAALGGVMFLLIVYLQSDLGYSALEAGASLLPVTVLMLVFSPRAGALAQRIGPRLPMTIGPLIVGGGIALLARAEPGTTYWETVFPGALVLGAGLSLTVAPLTASVLAAVDDAHAGIASAVNNAVARIAGLLAIAVLPAAAGLAGAGAGLDLEAGFARAMLIAAAVAASGAVIAWCTIRRTESVYAVSGALSLPPCGDPCLRERAAPQAA